MTRRKARRVRIARNKLRRSTRHASARWTYAALAAMHPLLAYGVKLDWQVAPSPPFASIKFEVDDFGKRLQLRVLPLGYADRMEIDIGFTRKLDA